MWSGGKNACIKGVRLLPWEFLTFPPILLLNVLYSNFEYNATSDIGVLGHDFLFMSHHSPWVEPGQDSLLSWFLGWTSARHHSINFPRSQLPVVSFCPMSCPMWLHSLELQRISSVGPLTAHWKVLACLKVSITRPLPLVTCVFSFFSRVSDEPQRNVTPTQSRPICFSSWANWSCKLGRTLLPLMF